MNPLRLIATVALLCTTTALAAPRDRIDPKTITNKISLTPGSKGTIQFKQQGDILTEAKLVQNPDVKQPGISVEFKKQPELLLLILKNDFPKALRYRAAVRLKGRNDYAETSLVNPVLAGLSSYESWQDPIEELVLFDFKLTDEKQ